tara:strand:+ start:693 stop:1232 length:540 start_codon:yes stop_codon:yes gene_type:complete
MATILDVIKGLSQAASNAYDGYNMDEKIGLKREEGHPILDSRVMDGFKVRFSADQLIITYHSEVLMKEVHPRGQFENEIERKFGDIVKYLKKEYRKVMKSAVTLNEVDDADIMVQSTSRVRNFVQAVKRYKIGGVEGVENIKQPSKDTVDDGIKKFLDLFSDKRPSNDKAPKNPDTPEA